MAEKKILIRGGHVLSMDARIGDLPRGDVLVEGARIAAVGPRLDAAADEVVDAAGALVLPGLIDTHFHMWQAPLRGLAAGAWQDQYLRTVHPMSARYTAEDMRIATYASAAELLGNGVTTVLDFCHSVNSPDFGDASIDALRSAGIRAIFGYGFHHRPDVERQAFHGLDDRLGDARRLRAERLADDDGLVRMGVALSNWGHGGGDHERELACARELDVLTTVHTVLPGYVTALHRRGLLGPDIVHAHATTLTDEELRLLADHGGSVAATPEVEIALEGLYPMTGRAVRAGVPVGLGCDVISMVSGDLLVQMRIALQVERFRNAQEFRVRGLAPEGAECVPGLDARKVLEMATIDAARALGLDGRTGSLTPGKDADVILLATASFGASVGDPADHVVSQANAADITDVLVAGRFRKRAGELVDIDLGRVRDDIEESRRRLFAVPAPARD